MKPSFKMEPANPHQTIRHGLLVAPLLAATFAIVACRSAPPKEAYIPLLNILVNGTVPEKIDACNELIKKGEPAIQKTMRFLKHPHPRVRGTAVDCLGRVPSPSNDLIAEVQRVLTDEDERVRSWGAAAIGSYAPKSKAAIPSLVALLKDPVRHVRIRASQALVKFGDEGVSALELAKPSLDDRTRQLIDLSIKSGKEGKN